MVERLGTCTDADNVQFQHCTQELYDHEEQVSLPAIVDQMRARQLFTESATARGLVPKNSNSRLFRYLAFSPYEAMLFTKS